MLKTDMLRSLWDAEKVAELFEISPFEIYLLGGSACVLAGYFDRSTVDFDFIDLDYSSKLSRVFKMLSPFDMVDFQLASIPPSYKQRARRLPEFHYLNIFVLSPEDIIVSKLIRYSETDRHDIKRLLALADKNLVHELIEQTLARADLPQKGKQILKENAAALRGDFGV